jgi:hypothetical protein
MSRKLGSEIIFSQFFKIGLFFLLFFTCSEEACDVKFAPLDRLRNLDAVDLTNYLGTIRFSLDADRSNGVDFITRAKSPSKGCVNHYLSTMIFDTICPNKNQRGASAAIE